MSARAKCTPWKLAIGLPNCLRVVVYLRHSASAPSAMPSASAPRPMRPPSSVWRNCRNPSFIVPRTFSFGTTASWNTSSRVSEARQPSLSSFLAARTPGHLGSAASWPTPTRAASARSVVSLVTMNAVMPRVFWAAGSVRALTTKTSPTPACVMKIFEPLSTKWSPLSRATVLVPPAPDPGQHFPRREPGHVAPLLLLGPEIHDRRCAERGVGAHGDGVARVHLGELVDDDDVGEVVHPGAAELFRPGDAEQAELGHLLHVVPGELALEVVLACGRFHDLLGEVAHHVADLEVLVGEVEGVVHGGQS